MELAAANPPTSQLRRPRARLAVDGAEGENGEAGCRWPLFIRVVDLTGAGNQAKQLLTNRKGKRWTRPSGGRPRVRRERM